MPGFELAKVCARKFKEEAKPSTIGIVLLKHGLFSFGATAEESYGRMISLVERAKKYLQERGAWDSPISSIGPLLPLRLQLTELRRDISKSAGFPLVMSTSSDPKCFAFARAGNVREVSQRGP